MVPRHPRGFRQQSFAGGRIASRDDLRQVPDRADHGGVRSSEQLGPNVDRLPVVPLCPLAVANLLVEEPSVVQEAGV